MFVARIRRDPASGLGPYDWLDLEADRQTSCLPLLSWSVSEMLTRDRHGGLIGHAWHSDLDIKGSRLARG